MKPGEQVVWPVSGKEYEVAWAEQSVTGVTSLVLIAPAGRRVGFSCPDDHEFTLAIGELVPA